MMKAPKIDPSTLPQAPESAPMFGQLASSKKPQGKSTTPTNNPSFFPPGQQNLGQKSLIGQ